ncbi:MAG: AlpA family transcriptional regulator [Gemmatimonadota bacterium]|nr:AlpA family transcriptional regulator [Gemmatimonadota bacterium]
MLRLPEVMARTGLSRTTIYRWRRAGRFPQAVPLGTRCVGFIESELEAWLRERIAQRPGGAGIAAY